uniref:Mitochondrial fission process protein 1 n=1 Tax=Wuchereria bancrofti TaxID=6293 RepID=A0A1I8ENW0_WUCBA
MMNELTIYDKAQEDLHEVDIYRDTVVRFLGYANEVGEAFRAWVPANAVRISYVIAMGYVFSDTADKSRKTYQLNYLNNKERYRAVASRAVDTLIWQSLASVVIPGFMISRVCYLSTKLLTWLVNQMVIKIIGLCTIPFIVKPIDTAVEIGMQSSIRKFYSVEVFRNYSKEDSG